MLKNAAHASDLTTAAGKGWALGMWIPGKTPHPSEEEYAANQQSQHASAACMIVHWCMIVDDASLRDWICY
jgi:hypothetical protein